MEADFKSYSCSDAFRFSLYLLSALKKEWNCDNIISFFPKMPREGKKPAYQRLAFLEESTKVMAYVLDLISILVQ